MRRSIRERPAGVKSGRRASAATAALLGLVALFVTTGAIRACTWQDAGAVELRPVAAALPVSAAHPRFALAGVWELRSPDPSFGGFSGLLLRGDALLLLSDRSTLWRAPLATPAGPPAADGWQKCVLEGSTGPVDSEGLAAAADGTLVISAEDGTGLYRIDPGGGRLAPLFAALPAWLRPQQPNLGIEALTDLTGGGLLGLTEGLQAGPGAVRAARFTGGDAVPLRYPVSDGFVPVGADRAGSRVYVLERRFAFFAGFAARLVELARIPARPDAALVTRELLRLQAPFPVDNFEGLATSPDGRRLFLVSDDNFSPLQRTLLVILQAAG